MFKWDFIRIWVCSRGAHTATLCETIWKASFITCEWETFRPSLYPHKWIQPDPVYILCRMQPREGKGQSEGAMNKRTASYEKLGQTNNRMTVVPRRALKSWLPRIADTLPTLVFRDCSSGLVRWVWYRLSSPTARSVSVVDSTQSQHSDNQTVPKNILNYVY